MSLSGRSSLFGRKVRKATRCFAVTPYYLNVLPWHFLAQISENMNKTKQILVATNFGNAIQEVASKLPSGTYALAGGLAVGHWIQDRKTDDLDFALVAQDVSHIKKLFPHRIGEGDRIYHAKIKGVSVDFLKPAGYRWNREAIQHAKKQLVEGVLLPVVTPEYLILYKMHAERDKDHEDIIKLLKLPDVYRVARLVVGRYLSLQHVEDLDQWASVI